MEIAILVFFLAIFGGVLFLLALVWFIFRRVRSSRQPSRKFSGGANYAGHSAALHDSFDSDDAPAIYNENSLFAGRDSENQLFEESARDAATQSENAYSHESRGISAAPAEPNYASYDAGSSYDSSSSYDSGSSSSSDSSSSDSGGSSSSSSSD